MTTTTATLKTRKIAGYAITLEAGRDYIASRPIADSWTKNQVFYIRIRNENGKTVLVLPDFTYDRANAFLKAFNNGPTSSRGRTW